MTDETRENPQAQSEAPEIQGANDNAPLAALQAEIAELRDKYLRAVAETENTRKRAEREVAEARSYGVAALAREVLTVADNLARTLEAVEPEARASADGTLKALFEGVELTERELQKVLERHGVRRLDPLGEKFDPHFHQAMLEVPDKSVAVGTVVQVMQSGYALGERVLRPALVAVAKGGPKPAPSETETSDQSGK